MTSWLYGMLLTRLAALKWTNMGWYWLLCYDGLLGVDVCYYLLLWVDVIQIADLNVNCIRELMMTRLAALAQLKWTNMGWYWLLCYYWRCVLVNCYWAT
jgi:hypothetical protein